MVIKLLITDFRSSAIASQLNFITIDEGARSEIQQALVQGLEVTVHQSPINVNGWQGSGYSVLDPETGVGAYQISGGASGGYLILIALGVLILSFVAMVIITQAILWPALLAIGSTYLYASDIIQMGALLDAKKINHEQYVDAIKYLSLVEIAGGVLGLLGDIGKISDVSSIAAQAYLMAWGAFVSIITSTLAST